MAVITKKTEKVTAVDCPYPIGSDEAMDWQDGLASEQ